MRARRASAALTLLLLTGCAGSGFREAGETGPLARGDGARSGAMANSLSALMRVEGDRAWQSGDFAQAAQFYAASVPDGGDPGLTFRHAESLRRSAQPAAALALLTPRLVGPDAPADLLLAGAKAALQAGQPGSSLAYAERLVALPEPSGEAWLAYGLALDAVGDPWAGEIYNRAIASGDPDVIARAHNNLGLTLARTGDLEGALASLERAVRSPGAGPVVSENLALVREIARNRADPAALAGAFAPGPTPSTAAADAELRTAEIADLLERLAPTPDGSETALTDLAEAQLAPPPPREGAASAPPRAPQTLDPEPAEAPPPALADAGADAGANAGAAPTLVLAEPAPEGATPGDPPTRSGGAIAATTQIALASPGTPAPTEAPPIEAQPTETAPSEPHPEGPPPESADRATAPVAEAADAAAATPAPPAPREAPSTEPLATPSLPRVRAGSHRTFQRVVIDGTDTFVAAFADEGGVFTLTYPGDAPADEALLTAELSRTVTAVERDGDRLRFRLKAGVAARARTEGRKTFVDLTPGRAADDAAVAPPSEGAAPGTAPAAGPATPG